MGSIDDRFGRRSVWAYDRRLQAEQTPKAIIATLTAYGITGYHSEVYYGLTPQGQIDGLSPTTKDGFIAESLAFRQAGIDWVPVVVPRGLPGEAELHAVAARVAGAIVVDIETGADYWPWAQAAQVRIYARALREACGSDVLIGWQPDGRLADSGRGAEWGQYVVPCAPYVDAWLPQLYCGWSAYGRGAAAIGTDFRRFDDFRVLGPTYPTLYLAESLAEPVGLWAALRGQGAEGFVAFRLGAMDRTALQAVAEMELPTPKPVPPQPVPEPPDTTRRLIDALTVHGQAWRTLSTEAAVRADDIDQLIAEVS